MGIEREIEKAAKRIVALDTKNKKTADEEAGIISTVKFSLESGAVDFGNMLSLTLKQKKKKRFVKRYQDLYSAENILCQCIKQILDRAFKVRYPNRNKVSKELFNVLGATIQMSDFTIIKFDFKNYFNSISSEYVFEKYLKENLLDRAEIDLIRKFAHQTKYAYAGLCTSNAIAEIIAKYFDKFIRQEFMKNGIIYYERYIDDGILILNEYIEENEVKEILQSALSNVFFDDTIKTISFLLSTLLNNISKKKDGYTLFDKQQLGKAMLLIDIALYIYAFYPSFDQTRKIISILTYINKEIDFKGDSGARTKLNKAINRYSFVFLSGNVFDLCDWFPFFYEYGVVLDTKTEVMLIEKAEQHNDPIIWANLLLYSKYYQPFFEELKAKVNTIVSKQISRISDKQPMMQVEFWYILVFHNCPYLSPALQKQMSDLINSIRATATKSGSYPSSVCIQLVCDFLQQQSSEGKKPAESLFNWKGINNFGDQITYRTYQRTVFKRYKKGTYGLYASLD